LWYIAALLNLSYSVYVLVTDLRVYDYFFPLQLTLKIVVFLIPKIELFSDWIPGTLLRTFSQGNFFFSRDLIFLHKGEFIFE
jgi:hypothetical protein